MKLFNLFILLTSIIFVSDVLLVSTEDTSVVFRSDAKLELIQARSNELRGLIDTKKRTFAFTVPISSFEGFNSPLQRQHFNENYLESHLYKSASFSGKIIENIDWTQNGTNTVRAKGHLNIHGVTKERIIKSILTIDDGKYSIQSSFTVLLSEHDIDIPRVVRQKITEEIQVFINAEFEQK